MCDRNGANARQLTRLGAVISGFPRWSPDGSKIVFHSRPRGSASLYIVDMAGGEPKRLTSGTDNDISPSWSRDGRWIYYSSKRSGEQQIWRMPPEGGKPEPVATHSGYCPLESKDGRYLYFASLPDHALWRVALPSGAEEMVVPSVAGHGAAYIPALHGVYFLRASEHGKNQELAFFRYPTRHSERVVTVPGNAFLGLALSPDEDLLLYSQIDQSDTDLMLVQHFR
jgi:dipeptidyl aminopeptidase/acylaminoacyl peptidase